MSSGNWGALLLAVFIDFDGFENASPSTSEWLRTKRRDDLISAESPRFLAVTGVNSNEELRRISEDTRHRRVEAEGSLVSERERRK